jgi:2-haloalkanoic acid dehalogenase type II
MFRNKIKAVLFDLGETLIRTAEPAEIHRRILEAHRVRIPIDEIAKAHEKNMKEFDADEMCRRGQAYWVELNLKLLKNLGVEENAELLAKKIDALWWEYADLDVYPDVKETLAELRGKGIKLGIVTNGLKRDYKYVLSRLGLDGLFDIVVGSDACMKAKPNREIFLYAVSKIGVSPQEALFVGDSVRKDLEGARAAGLNALLIKRDCQNLENVEAIASISEVVEHV